MDIQVIHTPIRHIGYHKSSKSQANMLSSSPDVALSKKGTYINAIDLLISFFNRKESNDTIDDGLKLDESSNNVSNIIRENQRLKEQNIKLKNMISNLENIHIKSTHSNMTNGVFTNQKMEVYKNINKELKKKNKKLKEKVNQLEMLNNKTDLRIVNILDKKDDIEIKLKNTILNMKNFLSLLHQTDSNKEVLKSNPIVTNNSLLTNEYNNNTDIRNFTNFSEAENLNTSLDEEKVDISYKDPLSEQQTANGKKIEGTLKPFEVQSNVTKKKETLSSSASNYLKKERNEIFLSQRQNNINKLKSSGLKAKININKRERKLSNILKYK